jgi:hypothetical protein
MQPSLDLPDELGSWVKRADLPLSRLLRTAVAAARGKFGIYDAAITDGDGREFTLRVHGSLIASSGTIRAFLGHDERLLVHDSSGGGSMYYPESPAELEELLDLDAYIDAMHALGLQPVIDIGLPAGTDS